MAVPYFYVKIFYKNWAKLYYFIECNFIWYSKKFRKDK